ncbi:L-serine dehydratase [Colletotrichum higginsianum]|uniref:L-serine dehydratase n=2 Tax=Colletotrichum higginsianum TaxID=80884 RepID=A0A4T0VMA1_9PEZI|nr:L-serine dehydratase [Colletotrichum higginsianum]
MNRPSIQRLTQLRGASARRASTRLVGPGCRTPSAANPTIRHGARCTTTSPATAAFASLQSPSSSSRRLFSSTAQRLNEEAEDEEDTGSYSEADHEHAVISTFDLFSIGIGPSSSHTVGPMRAGNIFVADLAEANLLHKVNKIRVSIYGSLALTGEGHMTPSALLLGLESADVETVDTAYVPERFTEIKNTKKLFLGQGLSDGKGKEVAFDYERDFVWEWGRKLPMHSNGMRFTVFDEDGYVLATNDMFSVGGGFVVNGALSINPDATSSSSSSSMIRAAESPDGSAEGTGRHPADLAENMFYKEIRRSDAAGDRRNGAEVKPLDEAKDDTMLLEGAQAGHLSPVASASSGNGIEGPESSETSGDGEPSGPRYPFRDATSLLALCRKHNLTIAQLVYENEKSHGYTDEEIYHKLFKIWQVMDTSILESVQAPLDTKLPGSLKLHRRAPALYRRLTRGLYSTAGHTSPNPIDKGTGDKPSLPGASTGSPSPSTPAALSKPRRQGLTVGRRQPPRILGSLDHPITPSPSRRTTFPTMDYLTVYAIAVNETNAAGGRIVTAPTNGAAGIIPAVLKYTIEFISDDPERDIATFLLTAAAIGMLYKRGATISAAEGGCMAEVGVACSMAAGAFAACMGASPEAIEQAAEIGIEHNLGLTCDPIGGLVQAPCIERNALGAIKAISSANLALSSETGTQKVRLDDAIRAMRLTAKGMRNEFKETSLSGLATSVPFNIPVSVPDC